MRVYTIREVADDEVRRQRISKVLQEQNPNSLSIKFFVEVLKSPIGNSSANRKRSLSESVFSSTSLPLRIPLNWNPLCKLFILYNDCFEEAIPTTSVSEDVKRELLKFASELQMKLGRRVDFNEAIRFLLMYRRRRNPRLLIKACAPGDVESALKELYEERKADENC